MITLDIFENGVMHQKGSKEKRKRTYLTQLGNTMTVEDISLGELVRACESIQMLFTPSGMILVRVVFFIHVVGVRNAC